MQTFAGYGLVAILAFLVGTAWQSDLLQPQAPAHPSTELENPPHKESLTAPQPPDPNQGTVANRAIEHYRAIIQLGVKQRQAQQLTHSTVKRERETLAASEKRSLDLARIDEEKHLAKQEKAHQQLLLVTQKYQQAQTKLAQEQAEQARQEAQRLLDEERRHNHKTALHKAEEKRLPKQEKQQRLLNLHAEHQRISTIQARKAKAHQRNLVTQRERDNSQAEARSRAERTRQQAAEQHQQNKRRTASSPTQTIPHVIQQRRAIKNTKETFLKQAQKQKKTIRAAWKKQRS